MQGDNLKKLSSNIEFHSRNDIIGYSRGAINNAIEHVKIDQIEAGDGDRCTMHMYAEIDWKGYDSNGKLLFNSKKENKGKP